MGFFNTSKKLSETSTIQQSKPAQSSESNPVIGYTLAQLRTNGGIYRYTVNSSFTDARDDSFFHYKKLFSGIDTRILQPKQNMIIESLLYGTVLTNHEDDNIGNVQLASNRAASLQLILICDICKNIPLAPNKITKFNTGLDSIYFTCEECTNLTDNNGYGIQELMQNFPEHKDLKIVLNKKEFSPTILKFNQDNDERPEITTVEKFDITTIEIGKETDLTVMKPTALDENDQKKSLGKEQELESILEELVQLGSTKSFNQFE